MLKLGCLLFGVICVAAHFYRARKAQPSPGVPAPLNPGASVVGLSTPELALVLAQRIKADEATAKQRAEADALLKQLAEALKPKPEAPK